MKNIHVLSKIGTLTNDTKSLIRQNIYITNDEEIKDGDWCLSKTNEVVRFGKKFTASLYKKIILTTDQDLINNDVQAIDDEFLEWFVKNPSCEFVEVEKIIVISYSFPRNAYDKYRITIPKEEPKFEDSTENSLNIISIANSMFGKKEEPKQTDWVFEISSGYNGYRNKNTGDWIYESEYLKIFNGSNQETPTELEPVLAKLSHINDLGTSQWYEVVYYDDNRWCSFSGSKTFEDGERVIEWKYCKDCL